MSLYFKYMFCILSSHCVYQKISKRALPFKYFISLFIFTLITSFASYKISKLSIFSSFIFMIIMFYLFVPHINHIYYNESLITILSSFGLSFVFYIISCFIISTVFFFIYKTAYSVPYSYTDLPTGILQLILTHCTLRSKRFYKGIIITLQTKRNFLSSVLSLFLILYIALSSDILNQSRAIRTVIITTLLSISIGILFYWRHRITQTYREKLRQANEKSMLDEINEHKLTIEKLNADNKRLAAIIHADNKLVPAMLTAVTNHLENIDNLTLEELTAHGQELSEQLRNMAKDRQGILESQHKETSLLPKSGLPTVDGMLSFMEARSKEYNIAYKVVIDDSIKEMALNALNEEDLLRLLGDLIDNAIIAIKHSDKEKALLIHLGTLQNNFLLEISDSGIPFSIETYQRFGNEQYTTHKDSGGSGIGLMDIWKIKKKYKISLHIYEFPESHGIYTKKISFIFYRKNHFLLQTNRYKEITRELTRGDLYIFPYKAE